MIRVVLVDDQAVIRAGFRILLEENEDITVVGEASGGREAVRVVRATRPDVVCMDLRMSEGDGLTVMRERTDAVGGLLHAGPVEGGGWRVRLVLPLTREDREEDA